jgi:hypothetical protein
MQTDDTRAFRVLTRLFVRRLIDNDVISPHADRHESLAMAYGLVVSAGVFATFFLSVDYLSAFVQLPATAALSALSDRFLFIAGSITVSALGTLLVWDALALEPRDAAILGPLPIPARTITRAKLTAALLFGTVLTVALNAVPSILYPAFLTLNVRGIRLTTLLALMAAHATTVIMAGLAGFFAVLAIRGMLRILLGERAFARTSSAVQSALVVSMVTALLLAPTVRAAKVREWVASATTGRSPAHPVLWYLSANEMLGGHLLPETPIVMPHRVSATAAMQHDNRAARDTYRALLPQFARLATGAWVSLLIVMTAALGSFLWTNRRLPDRAAGPGASSRVRAHLQHAIGRYAQADPEIEAGFFFALQTLTRSAPHRTIVAVALALGVTHALLVLAQQGRLISATIPVGTLAMSTGLLMSIVTGLSYAVTVPAEPAASWTIRMAWGGDERRYLAGVKRAAILMAMMLLLLLLPLHIPLMGILVALLHSAFGMLFVAAALDVLFLSYRKLPFACTYIPIQNPKFVWPAGFVGLLLVTYGFATAERWALQTTVHAVWFTVVLTIVLWAAKAIDSKWRRERNPLVFDDRPVFTTERLGLSEHIAGHI